MTGDRGSAALFSLLVLGLTACFEAPKPDIGFQCGPEGQCPSGYECRTTGCCHRIGSSDDVTCELAADAAVIDAAVVDAAMVDASPDGGSPSDAMADGAPPADGSPDAMMEVLALVSLTPSPLIVTAGMTGELTVTLNMAAPAGGIVVDLLSNDTGTATVPPSITVLEGDTTAVITVTGVAPGSTTVDASYDGNMESATVMIAATGASAGEVIITEFLALDNGEAEFVELLNAGTVAYDITGWDVEIDADDEPIASAALDGSPVHIAPGERLWGVPNPAISADIPPGADFIWDEFSTGAALPNAGGVISLELSDGTVIDAVDYSGWQTTPGSTPAENQFAGLEDRSTQLAAGAETAGLNDDGDNWCVPSTATPGAANGSCTAAVINEVLANPTGADADNEFVEIAAVPGADLSGWILRATDGDGTTGSNLSVTFLAGTRVPLDGFLVYGDGSFAGADVAGSNGLIPGPNAGLQLIQSATLVDALGWGEITGNDDVDGLAIAEGTSEPPATEGSSNARDALSTDTGDNATDFDVDATPTPGAVNN